MALIQEIDNGRPASKSEENLGLVIDLCKTMQFGSLCAPGGFTPYPVMISINHFRNVFGRNQMAEAAE